MGSIWLVKLCILPLHIFAYKIARKYETEDNLELQDTSKNISLIGI